MMIETPRYQALVELVQAQVSQGLPPNPNWVAELETLKTPPPPPFSTPTPPPPPPSPIPPRAAVPTKDFSHRNLVEITDKIDEMTLKVLASWGERFLVFQAGGRLLEIQTDPGNELEYFAREQDSPRTVVIKGQRARTLASSTCNFFKVKKEKGGTFSNDDEQLAPEWLGQAIVTRVDFPNIPVLAALAQAPTLRRDGALICERGYDRSTGLYLETSLALSIPNHPTQRDAEQAIYKLMDLVADFEFTDPTGKMVWLAGVLSVTCRHTFNGPSPLFIFDASKRAAGKSRLCDMISLIATGKKAPRTAYTPNNEEMDKRITSLGLANEQLVLFDNVVGKLGTPALDAALTSDTYQGRVLSKNEMASSIPMKIVWLATGNGMIVGADTARRSLLARLEPTCERPEDRDNFRHDPLLDYVSCHRTELLRAALIIVSAYIRAGRPTVKFETSSAMGSFEGWNRTIRSSIVWSGGVDPCGSIKDVRAADLDEQALRVLIECWPEKEGKELSAADLVELANVSMLEPMSAKKVWYNALLGWLPAKPGNSLPTARELGYALRGIKDAIIGNFKIVGRTEKHGILWSRIRVNGDLLKFELKNDTNSSISSPPSPPPGVMG